MIRLIQLSVNDGNDVYEMLQHIKSNENEFKNSAYGMAYAEFKEWLVEQAMWAHGINLPEGYVPQTIYWLYDDNVPVGVGKIRHKLTDDSRIMGGNIGYAVDNTKRGKGYATILLRMLIQKSIELGIGERLLTVEKYNLASKQVIEKNGGKLIKNTEDRWYFEI